MHIKQITVVAALLGLASISVTAAELKVENSIRGRSGIYTVVRVETEKPTIAMSKQGQGVGNKADEERPAKARWHNPSRQYTGVTAHN